MKIETADMLRKCQMIFETRNEDAYDQANQVYSFLVANLRERFLDIQNQRLKQLVRNVTRLHGLLETQPEKYAEMFPANMIDEEDTSAS